MADETKVLPCGITLRRTKVFSDGSGARYESDEGLACLTVGPEGSTFGVASSFGRYSNVVPRAEALAWLNARVLALRAALLPPGAIVVRDDAETREAVAKKSYEREYPNDGTWWTHADQQEWRCRADAVLDALREVSRG